jgi:hypothetical protein
MEEKTFLNEGGVTVTSTRFIVSSQTFAMSGIISFKVSEDKPSRATPAVIVAIGAVVLFFSKDFRDLLPVALVMIAVGGIWLASQRSLFHVLLTTASGETRVISSKNGKWITKVIAALNDSIIFRG